MGNGGVYKKSYGYTNGKSDDNKEGNQENSNKET